jgi:transposase-like protein
METSPSADFKPPFCPRPTCTFHGKPKGWRYKKTGFHYRKCRPHWIQRFLCLHCRRSFSTQTFSTTYWLKHPDLLPTLFYRTLACSAYRQMARELDVDPTTLQRQTERLGRHCLLFQELHRPKKPPKEPVVIDGFESFEFSKFYPCHFHVAVGSDSHFFYAFTDSELRRKGRMSEAQKARRDELERTWGRPDSKSIEREVAKLVRLVRREPGDLRVYSDEHQAYPRAFKRVPGVRIEHEVTSSRVPRTPDNPLFPVNLLDSLIRHSGANHKRKTIAFSKRRQGGAERMAILQVWRNFMKHFSEKKKDASPAQRLGLVSKRLRVEEVLSRRLFPSQVGLPQRLMKYYRRQIETRLIPKGRGHALKYAF